MREGGRGVQIKFEHLTGLLAAAFAALFVVGAVYCIILVGIIGSGVIVLVTFADVVNFSIRTTGASLLIVASIVL
jgi:hypothetical protein